MNSETITGTVSKYPLDFEALKKGQVLTQAEIEQAVDCSAMQPTYSLRVLSLRQQIEVHTGLISCQRGSDLVLLKDDEADEWTHRQFLNAMGRLNRNVRRRANIDSDGFSDLHKRRFAHRTEVMSRTSVAAHETHAKSQRLIAAREKSRRLAEES